MPRIRTSGVFVPGKLPAHTYNARDELDLENSLNDYAEEAGSILTLAGPTKTGKTVLLQKVLNDPVWLDGQGITGANELWRRIIDELGEFENDEAHAAEDTTFAGAAGVTINLGLASGNIGGTTGHTRGSGRRSVASRALNVVGRDALIASGRALVVDDFHFIDRRVQQEIVRTLKPLVLAGVPIIFVAISHRIREVVTAEPDMTGRVSTLEISFWSIEDLLVIARKGFQVLNVFDEGEALARHLAEQSYGSPHLMQQFCRELCKANGVREEQESTKTLVAPPSWEDFFNAQLDQSSRDWALRLLRGPLERGSARTQYQTSLGVPLDGYGLIIAAVAASGPRLSITKTEIRNEIARLVGDSAPGSAQITNFLKQMARIAKSRFLGDEGSVPEEAAEAVPYSQPVLDYVDDGPMSSLHIADPFFAFFLAWGAKELLLGQAGAFSDQRLDIDQLGDR